MGATRWLAIGSATFIAGAVIVGTLRDGGCHRDEPYDVDNATSACRSTAEPTAPVPPPQRFDRPLEIEAANDKLHSVAATVIAWCDYRGTSDFWHHNLTVQAVDAGKGRVNVIVDHDDKDDLLGGHTLWYLVTMKRSGATITPQKEISATACRTLADEPLQADVAYPLRVE